MTTSTERPTRVGAVRAAEHLAERFGVPVTPQDIKDLAAAGVLKRADTFKGHDLFDLDDLDRLEAEHVTGQLADPNRLLTRAQAAQHLKIRDNDLTHLITAGIVVAGETTTVSLPHLSSRTTTRMDLYRLGELDAVAARDDLTGLFTAARTAGARSRSPFRSLTAATRTRAQAVHDAADELADLWSAEVWTGFRPGPDGHWIIGADTSTGTVTADRFAAVRQHRLLAEHVQNRGVRLHDGVLHAVAAARGWLRPGAAVILDTETTSLSGYVIEIAVIDAATGKTLLDTLVQPDAPIDPDAQDVHGISARALADAPRLAQILPQMVAVIGPRTILAYNADFDRGVLRRHAKRDDLDLAVLGAVGRWGCLMHHRSDWLQTEDRVALDGRHRALGDCRAAREVLQAMAQLPSSLTQRSDLPYQIHRPRTLDDIQDTPPASAAQAAEAS